jgi:hypothetical protein
VLENKHAMVSVWDPLTFEVYKLHLRFARSETSGPTFETMASRIEAIASHTGMTGIFRLLASDVFEVTAIDHITEHLLPEAPDAAAASEPDVSPWMASAPAEIRSELWVLQTGCRAPEPACDLETLLGAVLDSLAEDFGFTHAKVLLVDETGRALFTIAKPRLRRERRRLGGSCCGEGRSATVARDRRIVRVGRMDSDLRYGRAMRAELASGDGSAAAKQALRPEIPLPGLPRRPEPPRVALARARAAGRRAGPGKPQPRQLRDLARGVPGHRGRPGRGRNRAPGGRRRRGSRRRQAPRGGAAGDTQASIVRLLSERRSACSSTAST